MTGMDDSSAAISAGTLSISAEELLYTVPTGLWETLPSTAITCMDQSGYWHRLASMEETVQPIGQGGGEDAGAPEGQLQH